MHNINKIKDKKIIKTNSLSTNKSISETIEEKEENKEKHAFNSQNYFINKETSINYSNYLTFVSKNKQNLNISKDVLENNKTIIENINNNVVKKANKEILNKNINNQFILIKHLGKGAFGSVYLGEILDFKVNNKNNIYNINNSNNSNSLSIIENENNKLFNNYINNHKFAFKKFSKTIHPKMIQFEVFILSYLSFIKESKSGFFCKLRKAYIIPDSNINNCTTTNLSTINQSNNDVVLEYSNDNTNNSMYNYNVSKYTKLVSNNSNLYLQNTDSLHINNNSQLFNSKDNTLSLKEKLNDEEILEFYNRSASKKVSNINYYNYNSFNINKEISNYNKLDNKQSFIQNSIFSSNNKSNISKVEGQKDVYICLDYFEHDSFLSYYTNITIEKIKKYMYGLFCCLEVLENHKIIHRDVKPDNFLFNLKTEEYRLIDFGLAELVLNEAESFVKNYKKKEKKQNNTKINYKDSNIRHKSYSNTMLSNISNICNNQETKKFNFYVEMLKMQKQLKAYNRIGTRGFLAPEVLLNYEKQNCKVDIWSAGCILMSFFTKKAQFFYVKNYEDNNEIKNKSNDILNNMFNLSNNNLEMNKIDDTLKELIPHCLTFGCDKVIKHASKLHTFIYLPDSFINNEIKDGLDNFSIYSRSDIKKIHEDGGIDLLKKCLELDSCNRISAKDAKKHRFFNNIYQ